jgi:CheY-like chemotaxis protein
MDTIEGYRDQVESDFQLEVRDELAAFEVIASNFRVESFNPEEGLTRFHAGLNRLLALRGSVDMPLFDLLLRRLDNYMNDIAAPTDDQVSDIEAFLDVMHGVLDGEIGGEVNEAEFFRSLPVRRPADLEDFRHLDLEILIVDTNKTAARIVGRELINCGYRVAMAGRSFEALELAIRTRPDMIISSAVLDEMSGIDLAAALAVVQPTESIPFALLTSFDANDASLKRLPENTAVMKKGNDFADDFAATLERFKIA